MLLVHRRGCPLGAVLVEVERAGKPVMFKTAAFAVMIHSTMEGSLA